MDEDEPMTEDERLEAIEEKISEVSQRVSHLEGVIEQMSERIGTHDERLIEIQYSSGRDRD
jgi:tetrahydromethanopterin S-methyltransferase subunit G